MLKGIPPILSPDLMHVRMSMADPQKPAVGLR
jgi:L-fucose mutarotase/ribose pyranase (RbsD/FucU family)